MLLFVGSDSMKITFYFFFCPHSIFVGLGVTDDVDVLIISVPDRRSRDLEVVVVRRTINLGTGNLEWGRDGEGLRKGGSVYE